MNTVIKELLIKGGWFEGRIIETSNIEERLKEEGYVIFELAGKFIKEFGLLKIHYHDPRSPEYTDIIDINPVKALRSISKLVVESYENHCGEPMIPVAEIQQQCMTICITPRGWFYGGYDDWLLRLGENFEETVINLITGVKIEPVLVELSD